MPYEAQVGLWLNLSRAETRRAAGMIGAIGAALSGEVARTYFMAIADNDAEGEAMYNRFEANRRSRQRDEDQFGYPGPG